MITFKSVAHFFAKAFQAVKTAEPKIEAGIKAVVAEKPLVEGVTAAVGAGALVPVEDAAFALLGAFAALLTAGGDAAAAKLLELGLDSVAIQKAKDVLAANQQLVTIAKAL